MTVFTPTTDSERDRATTDGENDEGAASPDRTMGTVSHTNPETGESFGDSQVFTRGRVMMVDGGEAERESETEASDEADDQSMGEIDHTPREDAPTVSEVYERGGEGKSKDAPTNVPEAADE